MVFNIDLNLNMPAREIYYQNFGNMIGILQ